MRSRSAFGNGRDGLYINRVQDVKQNKAAPYVDVVIAALWGESTIFRMHTSSVACREAI